MINLPLQTPWWIPPILAVLVETIFAGVLVATFYINDTSLQAALFGIAAAQATEAIRYFFSSSLGSKQAAATIAAKLNGEQPEQQPVAIAISNPEPKP